MRYQLLALLLLMATPALADDAARADLGAQQSEDQTGKTAVPSDGEIVVIAPRLRGSVIAPQPPVMTLDEDDVAAYGAASLGELVEAISPQTGSGRGRGEGRPVMLLNGQRVSSYRELRAIPPEAIRRVEVLPEEVALRFGYPPNQRVINFILKDNFATVTVAGEYNVPTRGGFSNRELEAGTTRIDGASRLSVEAKVVDETLLTEAERGVIQPADTLPTVAGDPDPAAARTLIDDTTSARLEGTWSTGLGANGQDGLLSINGTLTQADSRALWGLDTVLLTAPDGQTERRTLADPLKRISNSTTVEGGVSLNKGLGAWQLAATLDASHNDTKARVDRQADVSGLVTAAADGFLAVDGPLPAIALPGFDRTRTRDMAIDSLLTLTGQPFTLPAGDASLTVRAGLDYARSRNADTRSGLPPTRLARRDASAGFNLGLPLTSRSDGVLGGIGDVSFNFSAGVNDLSDFGTLADWNAGLTWNPTGKLGLQASYIVNEEAPSLNDLGNPEVAVFNVSVFDFTRGEAVQVTIVNGGNPGLLKERQRDLKLSANWELPGFRRSNLIFEYFRNRSDDVTRAFPLLTPPIEAAFPGRAVRDASGRLIAIDRRPVTYDRVSASRLRWGINLSGELGKAEPATGRGRSGGRDPAAMMMRGGSGKGRWNLSAYHTYRIDETVRVGVNGPELDLLGGDAIATGGVSRHAVELEGGVFHEGLGLRVNGRWNAPVTIRSTRAPGSSDLRFGSVFRLDARFFVNLGMQQRLAAEYPFLKGLRLALDIDNLFDVRQKVTGPDGAVPLSYQADYRDPRGRIVGIDIRKMF